MTERYAHHRRCWTSKELGTITGLSLCRWRALFDLKPHGQRKASSDQQTPTPIEHTTVTSEQSHDTIFN